MPLGYTLCPSSALTSMAIGSRVRGVPVHISISRIHRGQTSTSPSHPSQALSFLTLLTHLYNKFYSNGSLLLRRLRFLLAHPCHP